MYAVPGKASVQKRTEGIIGDIMNKRLDLLKKYMAENNLPSIVITDEKNMRYLSSFSGEGYLVITRDTNYLVTDFRYTEQAGVQTDGFEVCDAASLDAAKAFGDLEIAGFENESISYLRYDSLCKVFKTLIPIGSTLMDMRAVKDSDEIEAIRTAESIGDKAFEHILDFIKPGVSEREIAIEIEYFMRQNGAEAIAFDSVVATGAHGAMPHAEPDDRLIKNGDFVVLDFGCMYKGYCGDMTRTVCVGKATEEMKRVYSTVLRAQLSSLDMIKEGVKACDIHNNAQRITDEHYPRAFGHALGHGVGLNVHESPNLSPKNDKPLRCGNVVTVEPGIYLPGFCGVRIEDLVVVEGQNYTNLTFSSKNLIEL